MSNKILLNSIITLSLLTGTVITPNLKIYSEEPSLADSIWNVQKSYQDNQEVQYFTKEQVIEDLAM